ncbi:serine/threonine-protein kinase [Tundrisphaera lichenicola]|uniref:serine/threonine-protein kinase n=1 Tax=Tundrisphaera lichenicola TaxID=2029860 RepID=UPI003EBA25B5
MSQAEPSPDPKPSVRLGSYLLTKQLGSGGMSNVFRAVHEESGSVVAVKVLPRNLAKNLTLLQRFIREAKSAEALDHPNIAAIYDRGFDQGRHYLVLEYVEGRDLHDRVRINGPMDPAEGIRLVREVAGGLRYASSKGMIHRDVKPANLLMTPEGHAKIIDLGLALQTSDEDERVTRDGTTVGTVDYMAPEQARDSRQTSVRSDIYSLGCTFYYLLTGSQPYPGGGLADKLARHYKAPIPDVRTLRPEISESLSLLIRRMMEKKPELRFVDYDQLILALDSVSDASRSNPGPSQVLDALIVDDEDEEPVEGQGASGSSDAPGSLVGNPSPSRDYLMAEILDDDDEDESPESAPGGHRSLGLIGGGQSSSTTEISLADLAAIESEGEISDRRQGRRPVVPTPVGPMGGDGPVLGGILEDDEPGDWDSAGFQRSSGPELSLQTWIAAGVLVGLFIAVLGFGVSMAISYLKPLPPEVVNRPEPPASTEETPEETPRTAAPGEHQAEPIRTTQPPDRSKVEPTLPPKPVVVEIPNPPVVEREYPQEWMARFGPPSAPPEPPTSGRPRILVRRLIEDGNELQFSSIATAFSRPEEVIELAGRGPFFEDNCQVAGQSRLIRAQPGIRSIIKIEAATSSLVKDQPAKFVLGTPKIERLILEGIDFAVDLADLTDQQTSLFLCRGAELTLRDCSITLLNASAPRTAPFSIFRVEDGASANRIVLEKSTIRGPVHTLFDIAATRAEIVLNRSMVIGEVGPLIAIQAVEAPDRQISIYRSVLASRGPIFEFTGEATPIGIRCLGSTIARVRGGTVPGIWNAKLELPGEPESLISWSGEDNTFVGWPAWLTSGPVGTIRLTGVPEVRSTWEGSDASSREISDPWPASLARADVAPEDLIPYLPNRRATLATFAVPNPRLADVAFGQIPLLDAPNLSKTMIPPVQPAPSPPGVSVNQTAPKNPTGPTPKIAPREASSLVEQSFDVLDPRWGGDLGRFLGETIGPGTTRATIEVRGGGVHFSSPIRLPDGLSIAILGNSPEGSTRPFPTFVPKPEATGRTMIELRGGDLALANLGFSAEGGARPKHWVRVEDGLLAIRHCRLRDPGGPADAVGALVDFVSTGTAPLSPRMGPFDAMTDLPTARLANCLIWTGDKAIEAEVGRGTVSLQNCLIIAGRTAIELVPGGVARDRFEADLVMERCTIASDQTGILVGHWQGDPHGPDRPWMISTRSCVYPRTNGGGAGGLLQTDPYSMARGVVFWQSYQDTLEVTRFLSPTGPPLLNPPTADIKKGWVDIWGPLHTRNVRGPDPRKNDPVIRYKEKERPRMGKASPESLELDPKGPKDLGVNFKLLPSMPKD